MKKLLMVLALAGCANGTSPIHVDGKIDAQERAILDAGKTFAVSQVRVFNAAGVNPVTLKPQQMLYAGLGCGVITSGVALLGEGADVQQELTDWCAVFMEAAQ